MLPADDGGNGMVVMNNADGKRLVELTATVDGNGAVVTHNEGGRPLITLTATKDGDGGYGRVFWGWSTLRQTGNGRSHEEALQ